MMTGREYSSVIQPSIIVVQKLTKIRANVFCSRMPTEMANSIPIKDAEPEYSSQRHQQKASSI